MLQVVAEELLYCFVIVDRAVGTNFIVEIGTDRNDLQCRSRFSPFIELFIHVDVGTNRSNVGPHLCNTHAHKRLLFFLI